MGNPSYTMTITFSLPASPATVDAYCLAWEKCAEGAFVDNECSNWYTTKTRKCSSYPWTPHCVGGTCSDPADGQQISIPQDSNWMWVVASWFRQPSQAKRDVKISGHYRVRATVTGNQCVATPKHAGMQGAAWAGVPDPVAARSNCIQSRKTSTWLQYEVLQKNTPVPNPNCQFTKLGYRLCGISATPNQTASPP